MNDPLRLLPIALIVALSPATAHAETPDQALFRVSADAAGYFGVRLGSYSIRYGQMPAANVGGQSLGNSIEINRHYYGTPHFAGFVCHEMCHVWQYQHHWYFDFSLPYYQQPHEIDAYAKMGACARAIEGNAPLESNRLGNAQRDQQPQLSPPPPAATPEPSQVPDTSMTPTNTSGYGNAAVFGVLALALTAYWISRNTREETADDFIEPKTPIDWQKWFIRAALILNGIALLYLGTLYYVQVTRFGVFGTIGSLGLLLMGWYYLRCIYTASDDDSGNILLLSASMYVLTTVF